MALHNLVFVVDVDYGEEAKYELTERSGVLKRGILQILLHLGYRYGLDKVRWGYKFFGSRSSRSSGLLSRGSDFKELCHKAFQDLEQDLDSKLNMRCQRKSLSSPAASVQNALKETLLDFQWDRPDITSPAKASLRAPRARRSAGSQLEDSSSDGRNLLLVMSECPRSAEHLEQYVWSTAGGAAGELSEKLLSRSVMEMLVQKKVTLHWMDTASQQQVVSCVDHSGADRLSHLLSPLGGRLLPLSSLLELLHSGSELSWWYSSVWGFLLCPEPNYRLSFPITRATAALEHEGAVQRCVLQVEPVCSSQRLLSSMEIQLKVVVQDQSSGWALEQLKSGSEVWVLHSPDQDWFRELLTQLKDSHMNMAAEVAENGLFRSALLSPLTHSSALLSLLSPPEHCPLVELPLSYTSSEELPEVVSSVLGVVYDIMEEDGEDEAADSPQVPEWALQELSQTVYKSGFVHSWFPQSDLSGSSPNLMENLGLLNAVPEDSSEDGVEQEFLTDLSELYQSSTINSKRQKCGARRTPIKQKMKPMSRSLQMLNRARLNVKALRSQSEPEPSGAEKLRRKSEDRAQDNEHSTSFSSEAELLNFLNITYSKTVSDQSLSLGSGVQRLLSALRVHLGKDMEVQQCELLQSQLLKSSRSIRQTYSSMDHADNKTRECQLQSLLRLHMCLLVSSVTSHSVDTQQMAEEVAEMLRIISLTKDPVFLTQFLQDELLLPQFLSSIPRVLADVYHSLGSQLPECLAALLPSDFFSDESVNRESPSEDLPSTVSAVGGEEGERLQELRERSAANRRSGRLTRHRSMTECSQRQIEVQLPKRSRPPAKSKLKEAPEKPVPELKAQTEEVTKVRRNLFNQETVSPSKKKKLPRSRSVSAVEGMKRKRSTDPDDHHKLLTKKVCETPLHKQVSQRLLHRQRIGRRSTLTEQCVVEESPLKPTEDVRRSPRLKHFASRRHSFYSSSQTCSRNLERALSSSQLSVSVCEVDVKTVRSPMRLLFGAAQSPHRSPRRHLQDDARARLSTASSVFESPNKTPTKSPDQRSLYRNTSPKTPPASQMSFSESPAFNTRNCPLKSPTSKRSPFQSPSQTAALSETPHQISPLKSILKTPVKNIATPKKTVTWSPTPYTSDSSCFKVPESPKSTTFKVKTPDKSGHKVEILKTPDKLPHDVFGCQVNLVKMSEGSQTPNKDEVFETPPSQKKTRKVSPTLATRSTKSLTFNTPEKQKSDQQMPFSERLLKHRASPQPNKEQAAEKSPRSRCKKANVSKQSLKHVMEFSPESPPEIKIPIKARREVKVSLNFSNDRGKRRLTRQNSASQSNNDFVADSLQVQDDSAGGNNCTESQEMSGRSVPESSQNKQKHSVSYDGVSRVEHVEDAKSLLQGQSSALQNNETNMCQFDARVDEMVPKAKKPNKAKSKFENVVNKKLNKEFKELDREKQNATKQRPITRSNDEILDNLDQSVVNFQEKTVTKNIAPKTRLNEENLNQGTDYLVHEKSPNLRRPNKSVLKEICVDSKEGLACEKATSSKVIEMSEDSHSEVKNQTEYSQNDTDSSLPLASTDEDSLDIISASVVKAQGLKMNISFSRKPSEPEIEFLDNISTPKSSNRTYGFRQTPDRQQREAAIRLGYANEFPTRFSTPRGIPKRERDSCSTYEVQMELQSSGLPKLKLKRTDSDAGSPVVSRKSKAEAGCVSPSICTHRTPAKVGKSGQTFICQSYTPTRSQTSPIALTPSPQSTGKLTPDYLNSWPRRKRVKVREEGPSKEQRAEKQVERCSAEEEQRGALECELGVSRLPDAEEELRKSPGLMWMDKMEEVVWSGDAAAAETPPSSRKRKPVTASGILALTNSPLLFKTSSASKRTADSTGDSTFDPEVSPFGKPIQRSSTKTHSRKKLLP